MNISVAKTVALVIALANLHNFSIDADDSIIACNTVMDEWMSEVNGAIPLVPVEESLKQTANEVTPDQLLNGGGHHFDDIGTTGRRTRKRRCDRNNNHGRPLPRGGALHTLLVSTKYLTRPIPHPRR